MTAKISQWRKIALLAAGLSTGLASPAWGQNPGLYQQHADGSIWQYTGPSCGGGKCPGWVKLDDHSNTWYIVADGAYF